jgi:hypothetical protein
MVTTTGGAAASAGPTAGGAGSLAYTGLALAGLTGIGATLVVAGRALGTIGRRRRPPE